MVGFRKFNILFGKPNKANFVDIQKVLAESKALTEAKVSEISMLQEQLSASESGSNELSEKLKNQASS